MFHRNVKPWGVWQGEGINVVLNSLPLVQYMRF